MNNLAPIISVSQSTLLDFCPVTEAVNALSLAGVEERGAIFTRREVVDFILDLTGYTADKPLHTLRMLEPSFGAGDFLFPAVERVLAAWTNAGRPDVIDTLSRSITAVELHRDTFNDTRAGLLRLLEAHGIVSADAHSLTDRWLIYGDFLLTHIDSGFDVVIGNPPYVRQELIADALMAEYRSRYRTIYDRADIYIPFIERSLTLLREGGELGFICADRWMKNRYGGPLRRFVADGFRLKFYVDMVDTPAFHSDVIAYPAITVISREAASSTRVARRPIVDAETLTALARDLCSKRLASNHISEIPPVTNGSEPWMLDASPQLALVRRLESQYPTLEEVGCKVGIGVATGADKAFIGPFDDLDVEEDRKLPLATTRDIESGEVVWRGLGVINPFADGGGLVDLGQYPRLRAYFEDRKEKIAGRHVAQKAPANWYRTIDRIYPALAKREKLLIPDIKGEANIVHEPGNLYPHHNLYFITSDSWDIRALQAVLLSGIARLFIQAYSTKMRGGFLRFQAQYLRRIRLPEWTSVPDVLKARLVEAAARGDRQACNAVAYELYGLTPVEQMTLENSGA